MRSVDVSFSRSKGSGISQGFCESTHAGVHIVQTASSSSILPPEVSPALRFVPIGCAEEVDDSSIDSLHDVEQSTAAVKLAVDSEASARDSNHTSTMQSDVINPATVTIIIKPVSRTGSESNQCRDTNNDKDPWPNGESAGDKYFQSPEVPCVSCGEPGKQNMTPSLAPTEDSASWESRGFFLGEEGLPEKEPLPRYKDSYCASWEEHRSEDWFPTKRALDFTGLTQGVADARVWFELEKLYMMFTSNCGVDCADMI